MEFYLGGYDLSGDVAALDNISGPRSTFDVHGINRSAVERVLGRADAEIDFSVFFNDAAGQEHLALRSLPTTDRVVLANISSTLGDPSVFMNAKQINYDWNRGADGSLMGTVQCSGNNAPLEWGTLLLPAATISSAGNSASENNGGASSYGLSAVIHCTAFSGSNYTATIQQSSDDGSSDAFATLKAFTQITAVNASERVTVTGAVEQYLRVNHAGSFSSVDVVIATRRGVANDVELTA